MAAFDLQEQEQIDALRAFWQQWGRSLTVVLAAVLVGYLGWMGWKSYQLHQTEAAATLYAQFDTVLTQSDLSALEKAATPLKSAYPHSSYAARASLVLARLAFEKNNLALARSELTFVAENTKDTSLLSMARLRLAAISLDEKKYDAALAELAKEHDAVFAAEFLDLKGDILHAKGQIKPARDAYREALASLSPTAPIYPLIQIKLDALGADS